jgi:hydrogenase-1 operon protein HyaE
MMRSPLIQNLIDEHNCELITEDNVDDFLQQHEHVVLFFTENPKHFPESNDVAVILPELIKAFDGVVVAAVVDESAERALHKRYAFSKWPVLVFLRRSEYLGVITGMQNWSEFKAEFERLLAGPVRQPPSFSIPVEVESAGNCSS